MKICYGAQWAWHDMETCQAGSPLSHKPLCLCTQGLQMLKTRGVHHLHQRVREANRALRCALEREPRDPGTLPTGWSQCFQFATSSKPPVGGKRLGRSRVFLYLESNSQSCQPVKHSRQRDSTTSQATFWPWAHTRILSHCIFLRQWNSITQKGPLTSLPCRTWSTSRRPQTGELESIWQSVMTTYWCFQTFCLDSMHENTQNQQE
jgi:hypothetical protein